MARRFDDRAVRAILAIPKTLPNGNPLDALRIVLRVGGAGVLNYAQLERHEPVDRGTMKRLKD